MSHAGWMPAVMLVTAVAFAQGQGGGVRRAAVERLATGLRFTEGPMWHPDGYLVFSDIPADAIYSLENRRLKVYRKPSGNSNGLAFDAQGRLVACEHGNRRVTVTQAHGGVVSLASHYEGKRLNSPNDVVVRSDGAVYFTDPPYGVQPADRELDFQGVYRVGPGGELTLLVDDFVKPNGLAFSLDEKVLYVADTEKEWIRAFDVREDGGLANDRVFVRLKGRAPMRPDGMKVDVEGNLYLAVHPGVLVVDPEGKPIETIPTPEYAANLAFGGKDGRVLHITARTSVYAVRVRHPGAAFARRFGGDAEGAS